MAADPRLSNEAAATANNAITALLDGGGGAGYIVFRNGTIPTNADTAESGSALATCTFSADSFGTSVSGLATASSIAQGTVGVAGTASWCRWYQNDGGTVLDCTVGTSGEDINFNSNVWSVDATVDVTSLVLTVPKT